MYFLIFILKIRNLCIKIEYLIKIYINLNIYSFKNHLTKLENLK